MCLPPCLSGNNGTFGRTPAGLKYRWLPRVWGGGEEFLQMSRSHVINLFYQNQKKTRMCAGTL